MMNRSTPREVVARVPRRALWRRLAMLAALTLVAGAGPAPGGGTVLAQEGRTLHAERTLDFQTRKVFDLKAQVGQVKVASVEFTDMGRGYGQGGIAGRMRGSDSEASTTLRAHFLAENPTSEDWQVSFTIEFLDRNGKVIDRATKKQKWDGEAKPYDFDHQILEYVVPLIAQVKIKLEGKLD
jgi:hypothetical protein